MSIDEQEIQFRKRARRRLVGAIALVLLMVTVLPMVLDDRSGTMPQQEIEISIPSQDDNFESDIDSLDSESETEQEISTQSTVSSIDPVDIQESPVQTMESTSPGASTSQQVSEPKPETPVKTARQNDKQTPSSPTYMLQIGVFSDAANVRQLESRLNSQGLKSSTEKILTPQGEKIRLRVGPYASRDLAEEAMVKVKAAGLSGMILTIK